MGNNNTTTATDDPYQELLQGEEPSEGQKVDQSLQNKEGKPALQSFFDGVGKKTEELYKSAIHTIAETSLLSEETKKGIGELFHLLEEYGKDIPKSDLISGYWILTSYYHYEHNFSKDFTSIEDIEEALYYCLFSNAVYGWKLIEAIINTRIGRVLEGVGTKIVPGKEKEIQHNIESYQSYTKMEPDTIHHAEWFSHHMRPAHLIVLIHDKKKIVVSIRGTMDLHDCLSDVICSYDDIDPIQEGRTTPAKCHKGMKTCAHNKFEDTEKHVLSALEKCPDYEIVFTGHSLGAGTAGLLCYLYKLKYPSWPIRAFLYGCPPIFDLETAVYVQKFIKSYVNREDIIPRLTFGSLYDLKAMIRLVLKHNPKMSQKWWQVIAAGGNMPKFIEEKMNESVGRFGIDLTEVKKLKVNEKIYTPGRVHFLHSPKEKTLNQWYCEETPNVQFDEIILSSYMYTDHMPDQYEISLTKSLKTHKEEKEILEKITRESKEEHVVEVKQEEEKGDSSTLEQKSD